MTSRTAASLAVTTVVLFLLPMPAHTASHVNLSRYVVERVVPSGEGFGDPVSADRIQELCADEDGCSVAFRVESDQGVFGALRVDLFSGTFPPFKWRTASNNGTDGDLTSTDVVSFGAGGATCIFRDGDGSNDGAAGFELYSESVLGTVTCGIVIID